jgi:hypothetical protein
MFAAGQMAPCDKVGVITSELDQFLRPYSANHNFRNTKIKR